MIDRTPEREKILLLGEPGLRNISDPVVDFASPGYRRDGERLIGALGQFRAEHGFGRAIAAPQIGILRRMIAMNLGNGPFLIVNPALSNESREKFTLWDDCMSFPWLMVRLERHLHVDLQYRDAEGKPRHWEKVAQSVSELIQHEYDHLDGILAVDHALDQDALIARSVYEARREYFDGQVDYAIVATMDKGK